MRFEPSVNFSYHPSPPSLPRASPPCPRTPDPRPRRTRSLLDAVHRESPVQGEPAPARARGRHALLDGGRSPDPRRLRRSVVRQRGSRPQGNHRGRQRADRDDGVRAAVPDGASRGVRAGERDRGLAAGGNRSRVLHELRIGVGRHRAQDRARLSPRARRGHAHAADRPRARLSRRRLRRHLRRRHGQQPQVLRDASCPASITCRTRTTSRTTRSRAASPHEARISPTSSSASSRCTTRARSPR